MHSFAARRAKVKHNDHSFIAPEANTLRHPFPRIGAGRPGLRTGGIDAEPKAHARKSCEAGQGPGWSDAQDGTKGFCALSPAMVAARGVQDRPSDSGRTGRRGYVG